MANNKNLLPWAAVSVLILVILYLVFFQMPDSDKSNDDAQMTDEQEQMQDDSDVEIEDDNMVEEEEPADQQMEEEDVIESGDSMNDQESQIDLGTRWTGTLQESDDSKQGNLMLVLENEQTIYINTSRDYSNLVGKEVVVSYEGTLESFTLVDIEEK